MVETPAEVTEFVKSRFTSPEQLDVFVLLYRNRDRFWTSSEVATEMNGAPQSAGMRLFLLSSAGLLRTEDSAIGRYAYNPNPALDGIAAAILQAYEADREALAAVISGSRATAPAKDFADAFRVKK